MPTPASSLAHPSMLLMVAALLLLGVTTSNAQSPFEVPIPAVSMQLDVDPPTAGAIDARADEFERQEETESMISVRSRGIAWSWSHVASRSTTT